MPLKTTEPLPGGATNVGARYPEEALLYRRQFTIGPRFLDGFTSWKRLAVGGQFCATAHPDLSTCQVSDGEFSITLFGYLLDPDHWQMGDEEILKSLLQALVAGLLVPALSRLGGRWVIVADTPRETLVFNDAFGMRQVHYTEGAGERWCAAQPGLLAATLGLSPDERALGALGHCANAEFWWPGPRTLYREIARLIANHSLDLRTGRVVRYWPDEPCRPRPLADAVEACCSVAQGLFRAAHHRFPIAQTITAGWDSRLSLAASRPIASDVMHFSMRYWNMPEDHRDLDVPARLLPMLGLSHQVIRCPVRMDPAFERLYMRSVAAAHYAYGVIAQGMHAYGLDDYVVVQSNIAGAPKASKVLPLSHAWPVRPRDLLQLAGLKTNRFMADSVREWLATTTPHVMGFNLSEIFQWEERLGSWSAASHHEWDIVMDTFDPMNCRSLMALVLSVPREQRSFPDYMLHRTAIERMWPEALAVPVNPERRAAGLARARQVVTGSRPYRILRKGLAMALRGSHSALIAAITSQYVE